MLKMLGSSSSVRVMGLSLVVSALGRVGANTTARYYASSSAVVPSPAPSPSEPGSCYFGFACISTTIGNVVAAKNPTDEAFCVTLTEDCTTSPCSLTYGNESCNGIAYTFSAETVLNRMLPRGVNRSICVTANCNAPPAVPFPSTSATPSPTPTTKRTIPSTTAFFSTTGLSSSTSTTQKSNTVVSSTSSSFVSLSSTNASPAVTTTTSSFSSISFTTSEPTLTTTMILSSPIPSSATTTRSRASTTKSSSPVPTSPLSCYFGDICQDATGNSSYIEVQVLNTTETFCTMQSRNCSVTSCLIADNKTCRGIAYTLNADSGLTMALPLGVTRNVCKTKNCNAAPFSPLSSVNESTPILCYSGYACGSNVTNMTLVPSTSLAVNTSCVLFTGNGTLLDGIPGLNGTCPDSSLASWAKSGPVPNATAFLLELVNLGVIAVKGNMSLCQTDGCNYGGVAYNVTLSA